MGFTAVHEYRIEARILIEAKFGRLNLKSFGVSQKFIKFFLILSTEGTTKEKNNRHFFKKKHLPVADRIFYDNKLQTARKK